MQVDYLTRLDTEGSRALDALKKQFGGSNLLNKVRTHYAFHHPRTADIEDAFQNAPDDPNHDEIWSLYGSQHGFN